MAFSPGNLLLDQDIGYCLRDCYQNYCPKALISTSSPVRSGALNKSELSTVGLPYVLFVDADSLLFTVEGNRHQCLAHLG